MENQSKGGPKTSEGKDISKMNALKHGLFSKEVLFSDENEEELLSLNEKIKTELAPVTEIEMLLIDRIVANTWRLKRAIGMENGEVISMDGGLMYDADKFFRYEIMLERSIYKALHELQRMQSVRRGENIQAPIALDIDISKEGQ